MRRGVGVAHLQRQKQMQEDMAEFGAQITAERVGNIADQLETLEANLRELVRKHAEEIRNDPLVRARFRQIADTMGVDLLSSSRNLFSGALGLGNFYYDLAAKVVEVCLRERRYCGAFVPLARVRQVVEGIYHRQAGSETQLRLSETDLRTALARLRCLGAGYEVVELAGVPVVQTTPVGVSGGDLVRLWEWFLRARMQAVGWRLEEIAAGLNWAPTRTYAALRCGVQDGSIWLEYPGGKPPPPGKEKSAHEVLDGGAVYWCLSVTSYAGYFN